MDEKPMLQPAMTYGAIYAFCIFAVFLLLQFSGFNPFGPVSYITMFILVAAVCLAMKNYRQKFLGGYMNYGDAFKIGILTLAFGSGLYNIMIYIFGAVLHTEMLDEYKSYAQENLDQAKGMKLFDKYIDKAVDAIDKTTLSSLCFGDFFNKMFGGLFVILICAAIFQRNKPPFIETNIQ